MVYAGPRLQGNKEMTKLDLALISQQGNGRPVPKEMDRHMIVYVLGQRKAAVDAAIAIM